MLQAGHCLSLGCCWLCSRPSLRRKTVISLRPRSPRRHHPRTTMQPLRKRRWATVSRRKAVCRPLCARTKTAKLRIRLAPFRRFAGIAKRLPPRFTSTFTRRCIGPSGSIDLTETTVTQRGNGISHLNSPNFRKIKNSETCSLTVSERYPCRLTASGVMSCMRTINFGQ
jgi:hypothetical protein